MSSVPSHPHPLSAPRGTAANTEGASVRTTLYNCRTASHQLHVLIVGCGVGGLAAAHCLGQAGHKVTLFEAASAIREVGAGIHLTPNVSRLLRRWGAGPALDAIAVRSQAIILRRYSTGERVGYTPLMNMQEKHGAPYYRMDLHKLLFDLAAPFMTLRLNATVVDVDPEAPSVTLASGEVVRGDLVVGADGIKSLTQRVILGSTQPAELSGDAVYRVIIPAHKLFEDPDLRSLVDVREPMGWMGPGRHIVAYSVREKQEYRLTLFNEDDGFAEAWKDMGSIGKMRADFADFEPRIRKLLDITPSAFKWQPVPRKPLKTWVHPSSRVVLLGDACHPMLLFHTQGAAMTLEDAAVLGSLLSRLAHPAQLTVLLRAYQELRLPRATDVLDRARLHQSIFRLPDGPEQETRDADMRMRAAGYERRGRENCDLEALASEELVGGVDQVGLEYDADEVAEEWWRDGGEGKLRRSTVGPAVGQRDSGGAPVIPTRSRL